MTQTTRFNVIIALCSVILLSLSVIVAYFLNPKFNTQQENITQDSRLAQIFNPQISTQPVFPGKKVERDPNLSNEQNLVRDYLANNLSTLSPTKEELGGKFYLTKINFVRPNQAIIDYEDGHIALQAEVSYKLDAQELKVTDFKIIKQ